MIWVYAGILAAAAAGMLQRSYSDSGSSSGLHRRIPDHCRFVQTDTKAHCPGLLTEAAYVHHFFQYAVAY